MYMYFVRPRLSSVFHSAHGRRRRRSVYDFPPVSTDREISTSGSVRKYVPSGGHVLVARGPCTHTQRERENVGATECKPRRITHLINKQKYTNDIRC